jgi:hypothetical protein
MFGLCVDVRVDVRVEVGIELGFVDAVSARSAAAICHDGNDDIVKVRRVAG